MPEPLDIARARRERRKAHPRTLMAKAAKRYAEACVAHSWAGSADPRERSGIAQELDAATLALATAITDHIPE